MSDLQDRIASRGILTLSRESAVCALSSGNPDAPRLLLYLALHDEPDALSRAEKALGLDGARLSAALSALGLSEPEKQAQTPPPRTPVQTLPEYTGEELSQALSDPNFGFIYEQAEKAFNRPLRRHELSTLLALYEDVGVSAEVLALVLTYCTQRASQQTPAGENVRISFSQVRTEALRWHEAGVSNAEQAEKHIRMLEEKQQKLARVRRIVGVTDRRPSPTELRYMEYFITLDPSLALIEKAYDITAVNKGSVVWPYMQKILLRWREKGYKTPADVDAGEEQKRAPVRNLTPLKEDADYEDEVLRFIHEHNSDNQ